MTAQSQTQAQAVNFFLADLRELQFVLFEQFGLTDLLNTSLFKRSFDENGARMVLTEAYKFAAEVLGPLNTSGDAEGCRLVNGAVQAPAGFAEAWQKIYDTGLRTTSVSPEWGGLGAPTLLAVAVEEMLTAANTAFTMYPGLASGAAEVIQQFGTAEQKALYLPRLYNGQWGGTMCLTEPHAGSDVGSARTRAVKQADGSYLLSGTKIFISCGDHDIVENIIHLVLARTEGAPAGTKGLSLFIVPKYRIDAEGKRLEANDVSVGRIEHKMGINASPTCVLNFGENGTCRGELVGGPASENAGMRQMFLLMNAARIAVAVQSLGVASTAYLNAVRYAHERRQGPSVKHFKDPLAPRVPIIEHADVRRMLLDMRARVEGIRALIAKIARHRDMVELAEHEGAGEKAYHLGQIELLTPVAKAYSSDQAFRVCETAIQTLGGAGYMADFGIEQYCRDAKIFSIYEGTNHIQAMDLVSRKMPMQNGAFLQAYQKDIQTFVERHSGHATYGEAVKALGAAAEALQSATMRLLNWFYSGQLEMVPLYANRFLEMMAELTIGWLLLDQAIIADAKSAELPEGHRDRDFYRGKHFTALYFVHNILPGVAQKAQILSREDRSALDIPNSAFSLPA